MKPGSQLIAEERQILSECVEEWSDSPATKKAAWQAALPLGAMRVRVPPHSPIAAEIDRLQRRQG